MRTADEFFGSFCSFFWAAKNWSSVVAGLANVAFSFSAELGVLFDEDFALLVLLNG